MMDEHLELVRARQADPQTDANARARAAAVSKRLRDLYANELALALQNEKRPGKKFIWLHKIGNALGKAMEGIAPCRDGCSDCCHMATLISKQEAEAISKATGKPMSIPPREVFTRHDVEVERVQYKGVPCTMLKDGRCSIYAQRPWACRIHYSMDSDALLCKIRKDVEIEAMHFDARQFNMLYILAHGPAEKFFDMEMADIREFFPEGV